MAATATSIDHAASGFLRHRFVRAIAASWLVFLIVLSSGYVGWAMFNDEDLTKDGPGIAIGGGLVALLLLAGGAVLAATVLTAIIDVVHRRLIALVFLIALIPVVLVFGLAALGGVGDEFGFIPPTTTDDGAVKYQSWQNWGMVMVLAVSVLIALEALGWAWWQLTTSRPGFLAARGWRPPPWRLGSAVRRITGLPAYISNFGRGRLSLSLIYFMAAVLNLGLVALIVTPFFVFMIERGSADAAGYLGLALAFAGLLVLHLLGAGLLIDRLADARATRFYQDVREWDARAPIVFLRSFEQDDMKLRARTRDWIVRFPAGVGGSRTLDEILLEHGSAYGPVIAIGDPRDPTPPLGAARVFVPGEHNEWQHVVQSLVGASKAVVMFPNDTEGVKWELNLIASAGGRLRTIYLANPELAPEKNTALFAALAPQGEAPALKNGHAPIAAYDDPEKGWQVLTTAKAPSVQTYTIALNWALQSLLGYKGEPIKRPAKRAA